MLQRVLRSLGLSVTDARRLRASLALPVAFSSLTAGATASADTQASGPADTPPTCPQTLVIEPQDATTYVFAAGAKQPVTATLDLTLYTAKGTYELTLPAVTIDRPTETRNGTLRSAGVRIQAIADEPYLGMSLSAVGLSCKSSHTILSQASVPTESVPSRRTKTLMATLSEDTNPNAGPLAPTLVPGSQPPPCAMPFAQARTEVLNYPQYPPIARQQGAFGTAYVNVELDAAGRVVYSDIMSSTGNVALDRAALQAATTTTYRPAIFDCRPEAASYTFRAQFQQ